jgi:hypothetical protein
MSKKQKWFENVTVKSFFFFFQKEEEERLAHIISNLSFTHLVCKFITESMESHKLHFEKEKTLDKIKIKK